MPNILVKTKDPSFIAQLMPGKKPGYDILPVDPSDDFSDLNPSRRDIHCILIDSDLTNPPQIRKIKESMQDESLPVILLTDKPMATPEAGMWLSVGVTDIFQLPMAPPLLGKRLGSAIQLFCVVHSLHGQVTDELTGLYNRSAFYHFANAMIDRDPSARYLVILSDIDRFSRINERFGEAQGDALLRYTGKILASMNNSDTLFARYGGDQFVGMIRFPEKGQAPSSEFLKENMERFYQEAPIEHFQVKFGIYDEVDTSLPISIMCDRALMALKTIKHQYSQDVALYTPMLQQQRIREQQIIDSMETALEEGQFQVYYQPKHDMLTNRVIGAEALVRWNHPDYGFMSPGEFIPLFEENGFIHQLDTYVWNQVCRDMKDLQLLGIPTVPISVNASRRDLMRELFLDRVLEPLQALDLDPGMFHLEITESIYMEDAEILSPLMEKLHELGIRIELDDFGSGYSSLGILSKLPVDIIKLDISLIRNMESQPAIVDSIIRLMHILGYSVTAEGVETAQQMKLLNNYSCDHAQGYYYSKPLTFDGFCRYLELHNQR